VAEKLVPATQGVAGTQASDELLHTNAGALQPQRVWPVVALLVLYSAVVGQARQLESPSSEKVCAGHAPQTMLAVAEQTEEPS